MKSMFELWKDKKFPEQLQRKIDGFANAPQNISDEEITFRVGFYIGRNIKEIREK